MISTDESYALFLSALSRLDKKNLQLNDDALSYEIFEELHIEATKFLQEWTVTRLIERNIIPVTIEERVLKLRELILNLMSTRRSILEYRYDAQWCEARDEAELILHQLQ
jgi:hypothetical protein